MDDTLPDDELLGLLREMDPYEFEELIAELWSESGYSTTVRSGSRDRGVDVIATRRAPVEQKHVIQAKRYSADNTIGSEEVRKYATLYQQIPDADKVVLVTSSRLTSEAERLADDLEVSIVTGSELCKRIRTSGIEIAKYVPDPTDSEDTSTGDRSETAPQSTQSDNETANPETPSDRSSISSGNATREDRTRDKSSSSSEDTTSDVHDRYGPSSESDTIDAHSRNKFVRLREEATESRGGTPMGDRCPICDGRDTKLYRYDAKQSELEIEYRGLVRGKTVSTESVIGCKTCGSLWVRASGLLSRGWKNIIKNEKSATERSSQRDGADEYRGIH